MPIKIIILYIFQVWPKKDIDRYDGGTKCFSYHISTSTILHAVCDSETHHGISICVCGLRRVCPFCRISRRFMGDHCRSLQFLPTALGLYNSVVTFYGFTKLEGFAASSLCAGMLTSSFMVIFIRIVY